MGIAKEVMKKRVKRGGMNSYVILVSKSGAEVMVSATTKEQFLKNGWVEKKETEKKDKGVKNGK